MHTTSVIFHYTQYWFEGQVDVLSVPIYSVSLG